MYSALPMISNLLESVPPTVKTLLLPEVSGSTIVRSPTLTRLVVLMFSTKEFALRLIAVGASLTLVTAKVTALVVALPAASVAITLKP